MEDHNNAVGSVLMVALFIGCVIAALGGAWGFGATYGALAGVVMFPVTCVSAFIAFFMGMKILSSQFSDEPSDEADNTRTAA